MTTLTTLTGGLVLMVLVYLALGRLLRLSAALRALFTSSLALVVYFFTIIGNWPGLDVVAMHISIFVVSGLLLYMLSTRRRNQAGLHWVPKTLIGFFVLLAMINSFLLYISTRGLPPSIAHFWLPGGGEVNSGFSGVVGHGQEAARAVSSTLKQSHTATQLGWRIQIAGLQEATQPSQIVSVKVLDRQGMPIRDLNIELQLSRPGADRNVMTLPLVYKDAGEYSNVLDLPAPGRWIAEVVLAQQGRIVYREAREISLP